MECEYSQTIKGSRAPLASERNILCTEQNTNTLLSESQSLYKVCLCYILSRGKKPDYLQLWCGPTNNNTTEMSENKWCREQNKWLGANTLLNTLCQQVNCNLELYMNLVFSMLLCFVLSRLTSPRHNRNKVIIPGR